jgi:hypothetical protein
MQEYHNPFCSTSGNISEVLLFLFMKATWPCPVDISAWCVQE